MPPKKLTEDEAEEVRIDLRDGSPISGIAKEWNISVKLIQQINAGERYILEGYHYPVRALRKRNDRLRVAGDDEED
tara:strand:+ start:1301 stop:1528 length:228 start_codon:yes stop_codon:yes gene_type:complete